jgi:hypothetical protein
MIGIGASTFILAQTLASGWRTVAGRLVLFGGSIAALLAPWAVFVSANGGLVAYFTSAIAFSREEARANILRELPAIDWSRGLFWDVNGVTFLFYLFHALPLLCLGVLLWRRRRPGQEAWPGETSAVLALAVMAIPLNLSFLRDALPARVPDALVPAGLLGAWLLGRAFTGPWSRVRVSVAAVAVAVVALTTSAVVVAGQVPDGLDRAELFTENGSVSDRVAELRQRLAKAVPEGDQVPSRQAAALMPFMAFLQRCTARDDRVLVTSLRPEIYVIANRGFAGGHVSFAPGFYGSDTEQALTLSRLRHQSVPFVVRILDVDAELVETMPLVMGYLNDPLHPAGRHRGLRNAGVRPLYRAQPDRGDDRSADGLAMPPRKDQRMTAHEKGRRAANRARWAAKVGQEGVKDAMHATRKAGERVRDRALNAAKDVLRGVRRPVRAWRSRREQLDEDLQFHRAAWEIEKTIGEAVGRGRIVVLGPWLSEVGYETLYWLPFLQWVKAAFRLEPERAVAVSRGGVASWYSGVASRYVEIWDHLDPRGLRAAERGARHREAARDVAARPAAPGRGGTRARHRRLRRHPPEPDVPALHAVLVGPSGDGLRGRPSPASAAWSRRPSSIAASCPSATWR